MYTTESIRAKFISFFEERTHKFKTSSNILSKDDPTLMFVNAGMNQFKNIFLGYEKPKEKRIVNSQKCLRVSGKHNDLSQVGQDTYHHTFFEMLGNWSFGDYGKFEAISYAWEFLIDICKLNPNRIYATVYSGDSSDNVKKDIETYDIWLKFLPKENILFFDKKDNFWEMGSSGPCGPCTEIHYDNRNVDEIKKNNGRNLVNKDTPDLIEIWNLVFIEFNRSSSGKLTKLPISHVDTGMGLERLAMIIQNKKSNYEIDVFKTIILKISEYNCMNSKNQKEVHTAYRVIADHLRAAVFTIGDGLLPSNNKQGYVIRRIIRRALRYSYSVLGIKKPFLFDLVQIIVDIYKSTYCELLKNNEHIKNTILEEERLFLKTLSQGLKRINKFFNDNVKITGAHIFELYDTYGFPYDLTKDILIEKGIDPDEKNFQKALEIQKNRSRLSKLEKVSDWILLKDIKSKGFLGHKIFNKKVKIIRYREVENLKDKFFQIVLDCTPFYPESGGQVSDSGYLINKSSKTEIVNVKIENNLILHYVRELPVNISSEFEAVVDLQKRELVSKNHTATHILHNILRRIYGKTVEQKGSFLNEEYLRFDFSLNKKVINEELNKIETEVNEEIWRNHLVYEENQVNINDAKKRGAIMLFGEKYSDKVRVISFSDSIELCGGSHVQRTSEIGLFKIIKETSVSAGVRRIEAITSKFAFNYLNQIELSSRKLTEFVKEKDFNLAVDKTINKYLANQKELLLVKSQLIEEKVDAILKSINDERVVVFQIDFVKSRDLKKTGSFILKRNLNNPIISFIVRDDKNYSVLIYVSNKHNENIKADKIVKKLTNRFGGGGGGNDRLAIAGGLNNVSQQIIQNFLNDI